MFTIFDYIKFNKDATLEELPWNILDNLLCSILAYLPTKGFIEVNNLEDVYNEVKVIPDPESLGVVEPKSIDALRLILASKRYNGLELRNFVKLKNNDTQFGAVTIKIKDITVISFQGSDYSAIGWLENFRITYEYPTYTQKLAIDYLSNALESEMANEIYVLGHSKGGNLAMVSAMEASDIIYNKIKQIYNFDGPGFREEEYNSKKYEKMSKKLTNIVPAGSVIGMIMNNTDSRVVKTNCIGFNGHFPINWRVKDADLVEGELTYVSRQIHKSTTTGLNDIENNIIKETVEKMFDALTEDKTIDIKLSLEKIVEVHNKLKLENPEVFKFLDVIFNSLLKSVRGRK